MWDLPDVLPIAPPGPWRDAIGQGVLAETHAFAFTVVPEPSAAAIAACVVFAAVRRRPGLSGYSVGMPTRTLLVAGVLFAFALGADAMETLTFRSRPFPTAQPQTLTATGRVVIRDSAGAVYFETDGGARHLIAAKDILSESEDDRPFEPVDAKGLGERLLVDLPEGFRVHKTKHYVVAYNTSREYAEWVSSLLEGLHRALVRYWKKRGLDLEEPEFPLPVIVHRSRAEYDAACRVEGVGAGVIGYYHVGTNVVRMYDLTGDQAFRAAGAGARRGSRAEVTRLLSMPIAEPLVATVVHEATHQVCFNTGVMQRMADLPLWMVEGMAVYFEAPKAGGGSRGWRGIGQVNQRRLMTFRRNLSEWNQSTIRRLIASDDVLRDPQTAGAAYANAWALTYYLIKKRPKDYVAYVKELAQREPFALGPADDRAAARARVDLFTEHFGPVDELQQDLVEAMTRL